MSKKKVAQRPAEAQAPTYATLSRVSVEKLFKVYSAMQAIGEEWQEEGHQRSDVILHGYGANFELLGEILGDIYSEAWNSLPENQRRIVPTAAEIFAEMKQPAAAGGER